MIAVEAKALELMHEDDYAAVILAVLLSIIISPYALSLIIQSASLTQEHAIDAVIEDEKRHPGHVYYKLYVRVHNVWGLQSDLLGLLQASSLESIEFRAEVMDDGFCMYEAYLKDCRLQDDRPETEDAKGLVERMSFLRRQIGDYFVSKDRNAHDYGVDVDDFDDMVGFAFVRWMPGDTAEERVEGALDVEKAKKMMAESGFKPRSSTNIFKDAALYATTTALKGYSGHRTGQSMATGGVGGTGTSSGSGKFEGVHHTGRGRSTSGSSAVELGRRLECSGSGVNTVTITGTGAGTGACDATDATAADAAAEDVISLSSVSGKYAVSVSSASAAASRTPSDSSAAAAVLSVTSNGPPGPTAVSLSSVELTEKRNRAVSEV